MLRQTHIATRVRSMLTKESLYVIMSYSESKLASKIWYFFTVRSVKGGHSVAGGLPNSRDGRLR